MLDSPTLLSWREVLTYISGLLTVAIPTYLKIKRDRKKAVIEDDAAKAGTSLSLASAQSLHIRDGIATGEGVSKMLATLIEASDTITAQQHTITEQGKRIFDLEQDMIDLELARIQVRKLKGLLDAKGIPYSLADEPSAGTKAS